jgi:hypothetical protein
VTLVECEITRLDDAGRWQDVDRPGVAQAAADALLGTGRQVEPSGAGGWLVRLDKAELAVLRQQGYLHLEKGPFQLEAEWPQ